MSYSFKSDIYSLFMILYSIFKLKNDKYGSAYFFQSPDSNMIKNRLKRFENESEKKDFVSVFPAELQNIASRAISPNASSRPDLGELKQNAWFQDNLVKGIYYLENFYSLQETNKSVFLIGLAKTVGGYSQDIIEKRIIPFITTNMIQPSLMYNLTILAFVICEKKLIPNTEHRKQVVWPIFSSLLKSKKISGQLLYILVAHIDIICDMLSEQEIHAHILSLLFKCFDCKVPQIQLVCIEKTYVLCQRVAFGEMKSKILPRMLMLCNDTDPKVKKRALEFIKERIDLLDPSLVQSQAFTIIEQNLTQNNPASINFLILDLMEEISKHYDVDMITSKVLPILISFLANKSSSKVEFERYYESIIKFITRIKEKRVQELNSQPFKAKAEEPDDKPIQIQTLDQLISSTQVEGFDSLFAKQDQLQGSPQVPSLGYDSIGMGFESAFGNLSVSNIGGMGMGSPGGFSGSGGLAPPKQNTTDDYQFTPVTTPISAQKTFSKPPEKQKPKPNFNTKPGMAGIGDLNDLIGFPDMTSTKNSGSGNTSTGWGNQTTTGMGMNQNANSNMGLGNGGGFGSKPFKSNYDAFDEISLGNDTGLSNSGGAGNGFGYGSGTNTGNFGMGLGGNGSGMGGFKENSSNTGGFGIGSQGTDSLMMGNLGSFGGPSKTNQQNNTGDAFGRGISGLMSTNQEEDLFGDLVGGNFGKSGIFL